MGRKFTDILPKCIGLYKFFFKVVFFILGDKSGCGVGQKDMFAPPPHFKKCGGVCLHVRPSVRPSGIQSLCPSVYMSIRPSILISVCPSAHPSVCSSIRPSICRSIDRSLYNIYVCLSIYEVVCLSVCPPFHPSVLGRMSVRTDGRTDRQIDRNIEGEKVF